MPTHPFPGGGRPVGNRGKGLPSRFFVRLYVHVHQWAALLFVPEMLVIFPEPGVYRFGIRIKGRDHEGPSLFLMEFDPAGNSKP